MEDVLVDYHLAQAMADEMPGDRNENRVLMVQNALRKHHVTQAELDSSLVYWCENSEKFKDVYLRVYQRLSDMADVMGVEQQQTANQYAQLKSEGDTANIWNLKQTAILLPNRQDNLYTFTMDADTSYYKGDSFLWAFSSQYLSMNGGGNAYALLRIEYENDSVAGQQQFVGGGQVVVDLPCPENRRNTPIRRVTGSIYMPVMGGFCVLALKDFALVRYHNVEKKIVPVDSTVLENQMGYKGKSNAPSSAPKADSVRLNPHQIRGSEAEHHTINIVRDQKVVPGRRTRRRL